MKLYGAIGRIVSPAVVAVFAFYCRLTNNRRVRVVVRSKTGDILLLKNWVGRQIWELPGGGIGRRESDKAAAKRELYEETGIDAPLMAFSYLTTLQLSFTAPIYEVTVKDTALHPPAHSKWEIREIAWYSSVNLPKEAAMLIAKLPKDR